MSAAFAPRVAEKVDQVNQQPGRLDQLARNLALAGVDMLASYTGQNLRPHVEPIVDRLVRTYLPSRPIPLTAIEIAERVGFVPTEKQLALRERRRVQQNAVHNKRRPKVRRR